MALNAFDRELGFTQGRVFEPQGFVSGGDFAFVLGRDLPDLVQQVSVGDFAQVKQTADFGTTKIVRLRSRTRPHQRAVTESANAEKFTLADGQTLLIPVDSGAVQTVTFNTADFVDIANALAQEVVEAINNQLVGALAASTSGTVFITSNRKGTKSAIAVTGGTAASAFNFQGRAWRASIRIDGGEVEARTLTPGRTLDRLDLTANVSKLTGNHELAFRLEVVSV